MHKVENDDFCILQFKVSSVVKTLVRDSSLFCAGTNDGKQIVGGQVHHET